MSGFSFLGYIKHEQNSHRSCYTKNCVLKIFAKLTGKHLCESLSFNKVAYYESYLGTAAFAWIKHISILTICAVGYFLDGGRARGGVISQVWYRLWHRVAQIEMGVGRNCNHTKNVRKLSRFEKMMNELFRQVRGCFLLKIRIYRIF